MTALEYMEMEAEEGSFEEIDSVGVTFPFPPCFEDSSILLTDDGETRGRQGDISCSESRGEQERL